MVRLRRGVERRRWNACKSELATANAAWSRPALATASWQKWSASGAASGIPVSTLATYVNDIQPKGSASTRPSYDAWLAEAGHALWLVTACQASGCGSDIDPDSNQPLWDGWPGYQIDAPANQARAMPWMIDRYDASGELYWATTQSLPGAWNDGGQFFDGANGDGTLFYPGLASGDHAIGGTRDIPLESTRLKRLRDGREDYEYLVYLRSRGLGQEVDAIVADLYPTIYSATADRDGSAAGSLLAARAGLVQLVKDGGASRPPIFRPDAMVRIGKHGSYQGNEVFNSTGRHQHVSAKARPGKAVTFHVRVTNDGNTADSWSIAQRLGSGKRFRLTWRLKGKDVTKLVKRGRLKIPDVRAGGSIRLTLAVTPTRKAKDGQSLTLYLQALHRHSAPGPSVRDVVKVKVTARRTP